MKKRRQAYKKRRLTEEKRIRNERQKRINKLIGEVNQRLNSLSRISKIGTYSTKALVNRLNTQILRLWNNRTQRVRRVNNLDNTELIATEKALNTFLKSSTSTKKGLRDVRKENIEEIKRRINDPDREEINDDDAEMFYNIYSDSDFRDLTGMIDPSILQVLIYDSITNNDNEEEWLARLGTIIDLTNDLDFRDSAIRLYEKYIK